MAEVLLINTPIFLSRKTEPIEYELSHHPPLGLLYIASYLRKHGISVKLCDVPAKKFHLEDIIEEIAREKPRVVGLSALSSGLRSAVEIAKEIKKVFGSIPQVGLGGAHVSVDPTFIERFPYFDFAVIGEGEKTMLQIATDIIAGKKVSGPCPGEMSQNLDEYPFPARDLVDIGDYFYTKERLKGEPPTAMMIATRGCPHNCIFCSRPSYQRKFRARSAKNIVDEMEKIHSLYPGGFSFQDDTFTLDKRLIHEVCRELVTRNLKVRWKAMTRADAVDEELLQHLGQAGCDDLFFGIEAGNERIRTEVIGKRVKDETIFKTLKLCRRYGIHTNILLMLGFPTETEKELRDTINFSSRAKADLMGVRVTIIMPGSRLFDDAQREGLIAPDVIDRYTRGELGRGYKNVWPLYIPQGLTREKLFNARKKCYRRFYLDPAWILRRIFLYLRSWTRFKEDIKLISIGIYTLIHGTTKRAMS
jgi:radical SAM superfamily enzyme YgiQ (UPF0313 family)